ncbi:MAG TPA: UDP-N-acetylglucosamine 4,6-dehydratase, partial [Sulfuricurvum sp.]|nr:UDP-N-acetylglucosamine 4,6-dehydratase [Sulfuricurvum sp.]
MKRLFRPSVIKRIVFFIVSDILVSAFSFYLAYQLRFNFDVADRYYAVFWHAFAFLILFKVIAIALFKGYLIVWRFFGFEDAKRIFYAHVFAYGLFVLFYMTFASSWLVPFPRSVIGIDFFLSLILLGVIRSAKRFMLNSGSERNVKSALVFGANARA